MNISNDDDESNRPTYGRFQLLSVSLVVEEKVDEITGDIPMKWKQLTPDQKGCISRALRARREQLQHELLRYEILIGWGDRPAQETWRIVKMELDGLGEMIRLLWSPNMLWDTLSTDQRGCIQRAMWIRKDELQQELNLNEIYAGHGDNQAIDAARVIRSELDILRKSMRKLWTTYDGNGGNHVTSSVEGGSVILETI